MSTKKRTKVSLSLRNKALVNRNLDLAEQFLLEIIENPKRLAGIDSGSTIVLYPVPVSSLPSPLFLSKIGG